MSIRSAGAVLLIVLAVILGRPWIALAYYAATYPTTRAGEAANVVIDGSVAYVSLGERGFEVVDATSGNVLRIVPPPRGQRERGRSRRRRSLVVRARRPSARPPQHALTGTRARVRAGRRRGRTVLRRLRGRRPGHRLRRNVAHVIALFVSTHRWGPYFGLTSVRGEDGERDLHGEQQVPDGLGRGDDRAESRLVRRRCDVNLMENGQWVATKTVDLAAYDSGGDDGTTYKAADKDNNPKKPTTAAATPHFVVNGSKPPVARLTFTKM